MIALNFIAVAMLTWSMFIYRSPGTGKTFWQGETKILKIVGVIFLVLNALVVARWALLLLI